MNMQVRIIVAVLTFSLLVMAMTAAYLEYLNGPFPLSSSPVSTQTSIAGFPSSSQEALSSQENASFSLKRGNQLHPTPAFRKRKNLQPNPIPGGAPSPGPNRRNPSIRVRLLHSLQALRRPHSRNPPFRQLRSLFLPNLFLQSLSLLQYHPSQSRPSLLPHFLLRRKALLQRRFPPNRNLRHRSPCRSPQSRPLQRRRIRWSRK